MIESISKAANTSDTFQENTRKVLDTFLNCLDEIEAIFGEIFTRNRRRIVITNLQHQGKNADTFYTLLLDKEQILYAQKTPQGKTRIRFMLKSFTLFYNDVETPTTSLEELIVKIQTVLQDLEARHAIVYENKQI